MHPEQPELEFSVSQFVAVLNQAMEYSFSNITIVGELANFRISKNRWVYFDLKDEDSVVKFFGTVYQLPGPLEDGMMMRVKGLPKLHNLYGFSVNVSSMVPAGEGSLRKAADLLRAKMEKEGLFDESRKRLLPYPPSRIGLITSKQSAAYADFIKIINARWQGVSIELIDVQVQGEIAPSQIVSAFDYFNSLAEPPQVLVLVRGGGSAEDLAAFSTELVTRAVASSRMPTLVAIGHEIDISLAELAADKRASTPSNAAEILVPDRQNVLTSLQDIKFQIDKIITRKLNNTAEELKVITGILGESLGSSLKRNSEEVESYLKLLDVLNPKSILRRGYAIVRQNKKAIRTISSLANGSNLSIELSDGRFDASVTKLTREI